MDLGKALEMQFPESKIITLLLSLGVSNTHTWKTSPCEMSLLQSQDGITIPHSGTGTQDKGGSQLECVAALSPWVPVPSDRAPK